MFSFIPPRIPPFNSSRVFISSMKRYNVSFYIFYPPFTTLFDSDIVLFTATQRYRWGSRDIVRMLKLSMEMKGMGRCGKFLSGGIIFKRSNAKCITQNASALRSQIPPVAPQENGGPAKNSDLPRGYPRIPAKDGARPICSQLRLLCRPRKIWVSKVCKLNAIPKVLVFESVARES